MTIFIILFYILDDKLAQYSIQLITMLMATISPCTPPSSNNGNKHHLEGTKREFRIVCEIANSKRK